MIVMEGNEGDDVRCYNIKNAAVNIKLPVIQLNTKPAKIYIMVGQLSS